MTISLTYQPTHSTIEELILDANVSQSHVAANTVTEYPIESGSVVSDHVIRKPDTLSITGLISATPVEGGDQVDKINSAYEKLLEIRNNRLPVYVSTPLHYYYNMILETLTVPRDAKTGSVFEFTAVFREIKFSTTEVVEVAPAAKKSQGPKQTKAVPEMVGKTSTDLRDRVNDKLGVQE